MLAPQLPKIALALALLTAVACTAGDRGSANDTTASTRSADTSRVTTHDEEVALTRDVKESEREMAASEDSIYLFMGDSVSVLMKQAHATWAQYRKLECDAIKMAFAQGSLAPVVQMQCWIDLTDDHRKFLDEEYDYMRNGRPPRPQRPR
jgi:uncharacterized protein YecT (DUF1311 family)